MKPDGTMATDIKYQKIEHLGEYLLAKTNDRYVIFDSQGNQVSKTLYKKVRLERNTLQGYIDKSWVDVEK